jgi:hypothetical protein
MRGRLMPRETTRILAMIKPEQWRRRLPKNYARYD